MSAHVALSIAAPSRKSQAWYRRNADTSRQALFPKGFVLMLAVVRWNMPEQIDDNFLLASAGPGWRLNLNFAHAK